MFLKIERGRVKQHEMSSELKIMLLFYQVFQIECNDKGCVKSCLMQTVYSKLIMRFCLANS